MTGLVIGGPTGVGKTSLSLKLAKIIGGEILSADSMQVYKYMDIGTAKITETEMDGVRHHMLDLVEPTYKFSVGEYYNKGGKVLLDLESRRKKALLVGGTGLYISSLTKGLAKLPSSDINLREELEKISSNDLGEKLRELDEESFKAIHPNNRFRVIRALEVSILSGKKFSELKKINIKNNSYDFYSIALEREREHLYSRIDKRVESMFFDGLLEEAEMLYEKYREGIYKIRAIGYQELFDFFDGNGTVEEAKKLIKQNSRNYAKRQMTWFKNQGNYNWFNLDKESEEEIIEKVLKEIDR